VDASAGGGVTIMTTNNLCGKLVRLVGFDPEKHAAALAEWDRDTEYLRLLNSDPAKLFTPKLSKEWMEKHLDEMYLFAIYTVAEDKMIGALDLGGIRWDARNAWVGIGIGEREYWGKGYGTEAMQLILRFGFEELNLNSVTLSVFEYNTRAFQSYVKAGFVEEGRQREWMMRDGKRWDLIYMSILRSEWEARYASG
jgi:RimJ/RimL family protein N-acetyltransferase